MTQQFTNSIDTTLSALISDSATSATLTDATGLSEPTGGDFELLTLAASGATEIVKVTARSGNTVTIVRAQEGTTAQSWSAGTRVYAAVTAGSLDRMVQNESTSTGALAAVSGALAGNNSVAIGSGADADGVASAVVVGQNGAVSTQRGIAVGASANAGAEEAVSIGYVSESAAASAVAIGSTSYVSGARAVALGAEALADGEESIAVGYFSLTDTTAPNSLAIGAVEAYTANTAHIGMLQAAPPSGSGLSGTNAAWKMSSAGIVILSEVVDLKTTQSHTIAIPSGVTFFPEEVGVIITEASAVTGQPSLRFGITGTEAKFLAISATTGLTAAGNRQRFATLASDDGATTLRSEVTTGATGTTLSGRIYWRGFAVVDS